MTLPQNVRALIGYQGIKLRVKDPVNDKDETTVHGISMKTYIGKLEDTNKTKLHKEDKILLKHLTVDTLFCDRCYRPFREQDVKRELLHPFRVLLDVISCILFLFLAWPCLVIVFSLLAVVEYCRSKTDQSVQTNTDGVNEYDEYDREYFPPAVDTSKS